MVAGRRLRFGKYYTPPGVADLALGLALRTSGDRLWDPTCGDGAFLRQARLRGIPAAQLCGHDLDPDAVARTSSALPGASVQTADLFTLEPDRIGPFDAIAGNPPFVRVERLPAARRTALRAAVSRALGFEPPAQTDLSVLALLWSLRFLAPGGRLAFVMPNTWMDADFGRPLRAWLLDHFRLVAVVESRTEPWFPEARVNTVIVVFEARTGDPSDTEQAAFARCLVPAHGSLAGSIDGRDVADPSRVAVRRTDPRGGRWGTHLRAPPSWFEVLDSAPDRLPLLGDPTRPLLRKGYGTKVGIAAFFSPRRSESFDRLGVEPRFRRPFVRTLRDLHRYSFRGSDCTDELFVSDGPVDSSDAPGAAAWIAWGERQVTGDQVPWPEVPSVRGNRPWHALSGLRSGDVVLPQFRMSRHYAIANPDRIPINNSAWWGEWVDPDHREVGAALLNSTWVALAAEVVGRTNLGEGLLTCYGSDLDAIPLPDPARFVGTPAGRDLLVAWRDMKRRSVLPLADEVGLQDRRALDRAVMAGLGLDEGLAGQIQRDAVRLCDERVGLAASLREARRASAEARA